MKIRTFLALELSHTLRNKLSVHAEMISRYDNMQEIRWVSVENYHLTLVFLGDVEDLLPEGYKAKIKIAISNSDH